MVEDIVIDGEYVDSGLQLAGGLLAGSIVGAMDEYKDRDDSSLYESGGKGAALTIVVDGVNEAMSYVGETDDFGPQDYPEFWTGATLGHSGVRKVADLLDGE